MSVISTIKRMIGGEESPGTDDEAETDGDGVTVEFQKKNVAATAEHDLSFFASATYVDDGDTHSVERTFDVYTTDDRRRDGSPVAKVTEEHTVVRGDEAEVVDEQKRDLVIDVDPDLDGLREESRIQEFCEEWHRSHARPSTAA